MVNFAYAVMVEGLDEDGRRELDDKLSTPPGQEPRRRSKGTRSLMGLLGVGPPPPLPKTAEGG